MIGMCLLALALVCGAAAQNVIQTENARPGTTDWQITYLSENHEIEGYASLTSVNRGGNITFYVNTAEPSFQLQIFRLGWYGGLGGRNIGVDGLGSSVTLPGKVQPVPVPDPVTGLIECAWSPSYTLNIPNNADPTVWPSGIYVAKLTGLTSTLQRYIIFAVRDDARAADYLFQSSVSTFQAYNNWGGKSLYDFNSPTGHAWKVSFNRPYDEAYGTPDGAGQFISGFEYNMVRFLEKEGYDVTYATNVDLHENPNILNNHKAFLSVGHDEYWDWNERSTVTAARDRGVGLGFFSANTSYWQTRFEASTVDGAPDRTLVCYKYDALTNDPYNRDANHRNDYLVTTQWRLAPVNRPEGALIGVQSMDTPNGGIAGDIVITAASNPLFTIAPTGAVNGDHLTNILGYEVDRFVTGVSPSTIQLLAHSPFTQANDPNTYYSDMTVYQAPSGAMVFGAGTMEIPWGIDDYIDFANDPGLHVTGNQPIAQQFTRNVLARLIDKPPVPVINYSNHARTINFDGSGSYDPDGSVASYSWNFGDGTTSTQVSPTHSYTNAKTYTVTLTVTDNLGASQTGAVNIKIK